MLRWIKEQNTPLRPLGEQLVYGTDVIRYIRRGSGPSMPVDEFIALLDEPSMCAINRLSESHRQARPI